jgi:predicted AAA+ superfamily ATPase
MSDAVSATVTGLSLRKLCEPRGNVFERGRADTVASISDFNGGRIDTERFFRENHVTEGMTVLLRQVYERLSGRSDQGVFRLKQAMGGGKTHNLVAAGLLAQTPTIRQRVLDSLGIRSDDGPVQVAAFDGHETDTCDFLWIHLLKLLGRQDQWQGSAAEAPGASTWTRLIGERPTLIMLDEMSRFFVALGAQTAGPKITQADLLGVALANLMAAIMTNQLPRCCLVISDLTGAWAEGSAQIQQAIDNASKEIDRVAMDITPVRLDSLELYGILRARLFERLPGRTEVTRVAQAYAEAFKTAVQQGTVPALYERWAAEIPDAYPFHPGMHELFARFRENLGFQQTRETLRLARRMAAHIWEGHDRSPLLIHPHHVDFRGPRKIGTVGRCPVDWRQFAAHKERSDAPARIVRPR